MTRGELFCACHSRLHRILESSNLFYNQWDALQEDLSMVPMNKEHLPLRQNWMGIPNNGGIMPAPEVYPQNIFNQSGDYLSS